MHNLYLFQPQYTSTFAGKDQYWLPYSVGCLWAYACEFQTVRDCWHLGEIFFKREPIDAVIGRIENPSVCAFSCYVWNEKYNIELAKRIKSLWPQCSIVFGGPQTHSSYTKYDFIDSIVLKEGENSFVEILNTVASGANPELFYQLDRIEDLSVVPSPYATGIFDSIIKSNPDMHWSAIIETNRGCPYSCTFCDWGGLVGSKVKNFKDTRVDHELAWMKDKKIKTLFIADANFGIFKERDCEIAKKIGTFVKESDVEFISLNYAKNSNDEVFKIAKLLGAVNKGITFSVQSMNPATLEAIKRKNMRTNDISESIKLSEQHNIYTYTEIILGLPMETVESWKQGISDILEMGQHHRIEPQLGMVLPNTEMFDTQKKLYDIKTIKVKDFIPFGVDTLTGIAETAEMIKSTSTMCNDELIEAWLYSWMVMHMHHSGYSQLLSKYCRHIHNISYRVFYDALFEKVKTNTGPINLEYTRLKTALANMYQFGETLDNKIKPSNIQFASIYYFYQNIEHAVNLAVDTAKELADIDPGIIEIQKRFIQNNTWSLPYVIDLNLNIDHWTLEPTSYEITNRSKNFVNSYENFFTAHRRHGSLKSIIKKSNEQ